MKNVLSYIASVAIVLVLFTSCQKEEVTPPVTPPTGPADLIVTQLPSPDPVRTTDGTMFTVLFQIKAKNKDAYLPKVVTPFQADEAGGMGAIVKAEGFKPIDVMANVVADPAELIVIEGAVDKTSAFLIKADTECILMVKKLLTDNRGIHGLFSYELVDCKTFSNLALTEGKIHKTLGFVTTTINL